MKKLICFSLWSDIPKYCQGAIENLKLAQEIYPGWICRFYCGESVPGNYLTELSAIGSCEIVHMAEDGDWRGMFWRFAPAAEDDVEVMLSRDCDSRLSMREKVAVDEWLNSGYGFHIMRDHPFHGAKILGGMWGVKHGVLPQMKELIRRFPSENRWQTDQDFLARDIYPRVFTNAMVHDNFRFMAAEEPVEFPVAREGYEFVGQVFDENGGTPQEHIKPLRKYIEEHGDTRTH